MCVCVCVCVCTLYQTVYKQNFISLKFKKTKFNYKYYYKNIT